MTAQAAGPVWDHGIPDRDFDRFAGIKWKNPLK